MKKLPALLAVLIAAVHLHAGTPSVFDGPRFVLPGQGPVTDVRAADFDNDGKRDFAVASGSLLKVYRGHGDGTFALPFTTPFAGSVRFNAALLDDVAFPDLVLASGDDVRFYHGNGDGSFTAGAQLLLPPSCADVDIALAELTSDGLPDLVICGSFYRNLGGGNFDGGHPILGPGYFADANGDGKLDAFLSSSGIFWTVRLGNGDGTSQPAVWVDGEGFSAAGDFNADGRADFAWVDRDRHDLAVRLRNADGTYGARMSAGFVSEGAEVLLRTADLNGDGRADIIGTLPGHVFVSLSGADGSPGPLQTYVASSGAAEIAVADFNADGHAELLAGGTGDISSETGLVTYLRGTAGGSFAAPRGVLLSTTWEDGFYDAFPVETAVSDVTGDAQPDAIVMMKGGIAVLPGTGEARLGTPILTPVEGISLNSGIFHGSFGDFTGDGAIDVVLPVYGSFSCYAANGDGTFRLTADLSVGAGGSTPRAVTGDFDGDGNRDVAIDNDSGEGLTLVLGRGDGTFDAPVDTAFEVPYGQPALAGDVNGDGADDLVLASTILLGSPAGTFTEIGYDSYLPPSALVDLDDDGHLDVVKYDYFSHSATMMISLGNGDGTFGPRHTLEVDQRGGPAPLTRGLPGDFDADGDVDLVFGTTILLGDGAGSFNGYARFRYPISLQASALGDFDGNGTPDLVLADSQNNIVDVIPTLTTESLDLPLTVAIAGAPVTSPAAVDLNVTVSSERQGTFATSGGVAVSIGGTVAALAELIDGGAYVELRGYVPGTHSLTAVFGGDSLYAGAAATPRTIEITRAPVWSFPQFYPQLPTTLTPVSLKGKLESGMPGDPTGVVVLEVDGVDRGSGPAASFDITFGLLAAGPHAVVLTYAGDSLHVPYSKSWTLNVVKPIAVVELSISPWPSTAVTTPVTLTATFPNEPTLSGGTVSFVWKGKTVAIVPVVDGSASVTTSSLEPGAVYLYALYSGNETYRGSSDQLSYIVYDVPLAPAPRSFYLIEPCRILDTRLPSGPYGPAGGPALASTATRLIQISGVCGIPSGAAAVAMNVTVVAPENYGYLIAFPGASPRPATSTLNYRPGKTRANSAIMPLSAAGRLNLFNSGPGWTHVLIDVTGYFQ